MDHPRGEKTTTLKEAWSTEARKESIALPQSSLPQLSGMASPSKIQSKKKLKKNSNWNDAQLRVAFRAVERKERVCSTIDYYGIPRSTFRGHVHGRTFSRKR